MAQDLSQISTHPITIRLAPAKVRIREMTPKRKRIEQAIQETQRLLSDLVLSPWALCVLVVSLCDWHHAQSTYKARPRLNKNPTKANLGDMILPINQSSKITRPRHPRIPESKALHLNTSPQTDDTSRIFAAQVLVLVVNLLCLSAARLAPLLEETHIPILFTRMIVLSLDVAPTRMMTVEAFDQTQVNIKCRMPQAPGIDMDYLLADGPRPLSRLIANVPHC